MVALTQAELDRYNEIRAGSGLPPHDGRWTDDMMYYAMQELADDEN